MNFINEKRWELVLAVVATFGYPLLDAYESGAFHGKSLAAALFAGALIVARAAASHRQSPPA